MSHNANDYREAANISPVDPDIRAYMFQDLSRIKDDIATIDSRINDAVREANDRTEHALQQIRTHFEEEIRRLSNMYSAVAEKLSAAVTITSANAEGISELRSLVSSLKDSIARLDGIDGRVDTIIQAKVADTFKNIEYLIDNKIMKQQNLENAELPRNELRSVPTKVSDIDKRLITLERKMWLINLIGILIMGIIASFGKEFAQFLFKLPR